METPRLYADIADWWPLLSAPADYAEEAAIYQGLLIDACRRPPRTLLEPQRTSFRRRAARPLAPPQYARNCVMNACSPPAPTASGAKASATVSAM